MTEANGIEQETTHNPQRLAELLPRQESTIGSPLHLENRWPKYRPQIPHEQSMVDPSIWATMEQTCATGGPWPMVLVGEVGSGKTSAALCVLDRCASRTYETLATLTEKLVTIQNTWLTQEFWKAWGERGCVVLDEIGVRGRVTDFQYEACKRAIDDRRERPMIVISNLSIPDLARIYDDRIASRLAGGTVIHFTGKDRRVNP